MTEFYLKEHRTPLGQAVRKSLRKIMQGAVLVAILKMKTTKLMDVVVVRRILQSTWMLEA